MLNFLPLAAWISANITYGLYLSDRQNLDDIDTEMVVLSGIMIQNLRRETGWHLRGTRRVGVSHGDVEIVQQCVCIPRPCGNATLADGQYHRSR